MIALDILEDEDIKEMQTWVNKLHEDWIIPYISLNDMGKTCSVTLQFRSYLPTSRARPNFLDNTGSK